MQIRIYTDGACRANGTKNALGGWAYAIIYNDELRLEEWGNEKETTNNRMEMMAVVEALKNFTDLDEEIVVCTDSAYIHNCMKQKWYVNWQRNGWVNAAREPVKNKDLWEQIIPYFSNKIFKRLSLTFSLTLSSRKGSDPTTRFKLSASIASERVFLD